MRSGGMLRSAWFSAAVLDGPLRAQCPLREEAGVVDLQQQPGTDDRLVLDPHGIGDREQELLLRLVVLVALPSLDVGRRDRGHERLVRRAAPGRREEARDVPLQRLGARVRDVVDAHHVHGIRRAASGARRVEVGERALLPRAGPRADRAVPHGLEPAQAVVDVGEEARLAHLAVVDDLDAACRLRLDDLVGRAGDALGERSLVDRLTALLGHEHVEEIRRAGQAADVGDDDVVLAAQHGIGPVRHVIRRLGHAAPRRRCGARAWSRPDPPLAGARTRSTSRLRSPRCASTLSDGDA
jgi:hypothetical protein